MGAALRIQLPFDVGDDSGVPVGELLGLFGVAALLANEGFIAEISIAQINRCVRPRLLPAAKPVENLANVQTIEPEVKFFAHVGHLSLARFGAGRKPVIERSVVFLIGSSSELS